MRKHKRLQYFSIITLLTLLLTTTTFYCFHNTFASTTNSSQNTSETNSDYENALKSTPKGLKWANSDFMKAEFPGNQAEIVPSKNPNNLDTSVIKMTNSTYQVGGIWGNQDNNNYFDISHEQIASMWLYFGNTGDTPGDGMAFVLHNDPRGLKTIAWDNGKGRAVNGQSLGVWGADWDWSQKDSRVLAKSAIQNSWALEFDTYVNKLNTFDTISGEGVSFDAAYSDSNQHIAYSYPGSAGTYIISPPLFGEYTKYYYLLKHQGMIKNVDIVNSTWHHVTIKWTPSSTTKDGIPVSGSLNYKFNDKNPNGTPNNGSDMKENTAQIDTSYFNLKPQHTILYWGFTGSTGKYFENNLVVFESIPSFVDAEAKAAIYDDSQNSREITENDSEVEPNDDIRYNYSLNYKGWSKNWNHINAMMDVPKNVHFTSGTVTYPDSPINKKPRPIPQEVFDKANSDNKLNYTLTEQLDSNSRNAVIELQGKTEKTAPTQLTVPSAHASFQGDNLITDTDSVSFHIRQRLLTLESDSPHIIKLKASEDAIISGQLNYIGSGTPDFQSMIVHYKLNKQSYSVSGKIDKSGKVSFSINHQDLSKINSLEFYVTDTDNVTNTNIITRKIQVGGLLSFGKIQDNLAFQSTNGSFNNKTIQRSGNWQINVVDSREKGSYWNVQAKASDLIINNKNKLKGHLFYRNSKGKETPLDNNVSVASHIKDIDDPQTKNITDSWTTNTGILLDLNSNNQAGKYTGKIEWTLSDTLQNT